MPHLWVFHRRPEVPLYDSYVSHSGTRNIGITVARTFDDLMRVAAIRNSVYIGEQECPYDEEYDGNDLSATHLLAYIGDEPVGCLRLRFFADFAKFERVAIRKEYRKSRAAIQLDHGPVSILPEERVSPRLWPYPEPAGDLLEPLGFRVMENRAASSFPTLNISKSSPSSSRDPDAIQRWRPIPISSSVRKGAGTYRVF